MTTVNGTMSILLGKTSDNGMGDQVLLTNKAKCSEDETRGFLSFSSSRDNAESKSLVNSVEQGK